MKEKVRIHLVTDIHYGPDVAVKKGESALWLLDGFVRRTNEIKPELAVDLGDRISDVDRESDFLREQEVGRIFSDLDVPLRHILGNHDVVNLTAADNERALGARVSSNSIDIGGYRLVFWNANTFIPYPDPCRGALRSDIEWLRSTLESTSLPSVVFTHFPLAAPCMTGNYYFEDAPEYAFDPNAPALRELFAECGHVVLCVSGHVHQNTWQSVDDVAFFSLQSLTESFCTPSHPSEVWGALELGEEISLSTFGSQPATMTMPLRRRGARRVFGSFRRRRTSARKAVEERRIASFAFPVRGIALDLDGVVWRGDELIPGSDVFIQKMKEASIPVTFVTNNAHRTREQYAEKMAGFGVSCTPEEFVTSGYATARWIARTAPRSGVKVLGSGALREEIRTAGLVEDEDAPDFLVVSMNESLTVKDLSEGAKLLEKGTRLILTNPDALLPDEDGFRAGCGAIGAFLEACGREKATIIGKPFPALFSMALERMGTTVEETVMIGDTPETDIEGAFRMGMRAIRVESGNRENEGSECLPWKSVERLENAAGFILSHNMRCNAVSLDDLAEKEVHMVRTHCAESV